MLADELALPGGDVADLVAPIDRGGDVTGSHTTATAIDAPLSDDFGDRHRGPSHTDE